MDLVPGCETHMIDGLAQYPALKAYIASLRSIPAGRFLMGSSSGDEDEKPVHSVTLSSFRMGATPVTVAIWKEYCRAKSIKLPEAPQWGWMDNHPVVNVSWNDIMGSDGKGGFCTWASDVAGCRLSLPTEAQFEYAARGRGDDRAYPWGDNFEDSRLWCSVYKKRATTAAVVRKTNIFRNAFGLTDMCGNIWQWCSDFYASYDSGPSIDPTGPVSSSANLRCFRGGAWNSTGGRHDFRCANRSKYFSDIRYDFIGFRLAAGPG